MTAKERNQQLSHLAGLAMHAEIAQRRVNQHALVCFPVGSTVIVPRRIEGVVRFWQAEVIGYTSPSKRRNLVLKVVGTGEIFQYAISVKTLSEISA